MSTGEYQLTEPQGSYAGRSTGARHRHRIEDYIQPRVPLDNPLLPTETAAVCAEAAAGVGMSICCSMCGYLNGTSLA
jgi:hypothetical protein